MVPSPRILERRMDDHSVLARRAQTEAIARMHEDLSRLYREQLVALMLQETSDAAFLDDGLL